MTISRQLKRFENKKMSDPKSVIPVTLLISYYQEYQ